MARVSRVYFTRLFLFVIVLVNSAKQNNTRHYHHSNRIVS